jgi:hypothetical protein
LPTALRLVADIVEAAIPRLGPIIAGIMKIQATAIKTVNQFSNYQAKCSSPWIAPGWLIPTSRQGPNQDTSLWWTVFEPSENRWNDDEKFSAHHSGSNPALAVFGGKLHCVHRGSGSDTALWHTTFNGSSWSTDTEIREHYSLEGPALAVFDSKLYCIHRGHGNGDQHLWWSHFNGSSWSRDTRFPGHTNGAGPTAIAYRDANAETNQPLVVHRGYGYNRAASTDAAEDEARIAAEELAPTEPSTQTR